jgi:hypothetical protein
MQQPHDLLDASSAARRWRVSRSALYIQHGLEYEDWVRVGRQVAVVADSAAWWIGDWLIYGRQAYGRRYKAAIASTGLDYQTLRNYAWVASRFPVSRRRDRLSFGHYAELASLSDEAQDAWISRCVSEGWTRSQLRRRIRLERKCISDRPEPVTPIPLSVAPQRHQRWATAAAVAGKPLAEWIAEIVDHAAGDVLDHAAEDVLDVSDRPAVETRAALVSV